MVYGFTAVWCVVWAYAACQLPGPHRLPLSGVSLLSLYLPPPLQDAALEGADPVVWYSFGVTHVVRPEDFPIMPVEVSEARELAAGRERGGERGVRVRCVWLI